MTVRSSMTGWLQATLQGIFGAPTRRDGRIGRAGFRIGNQPCLLIKEKRKLIAHQANGTVVKAITRWRSSGVVIPDSAAREIAWLWAAHPSPASTATLRAFTVVALHGVIRPWAALKDAIRAEAGKLSADFRDDVPLLQQLRALNAWAEYKENA